MGKIELNKKAKKGALLTAALTLFTSLGFQKTSVSDIATNAGVAKGTFYLYFKDKYDIRNYLIAQQANTLFFNAYEKLQNNQITDFKEKIIFMVDEIITRFEDDPTLLKFISKHLSWGVFKNVLSVEDYVSEHSIFGMIMEMASSSHIKIKSPEILMYMIIEFVSGTSYNAILYCQPVSLEDLKPHVYNVIKQMIESYIIKY